jgi:hypothetical protein
MSFLLNGSVIRKPNSMNESNSTQVAQNRTLGGNINRDYFGNNKRVFTLSYQNVNYTDWSTVNTLYQTYLTNKTTQNFQITDTNYNGAATAALACHIDLLTRDFKIPGSTYLTDFVLILTES